MMFLFECLCFSPAGIFSRLGKVITDQVRQIDFAPTLLDALGLDLPVPVHGQSLAPLLKGESVAETPAHVAASGEMLDGPKNWRVGIRTTEWKYIFAPQNPDIPEELYHLLSDPHERRNLTKSRGTQAEELKRELASKSLPEPIMSTTLRSGDEMSDDEKSVMEERLKQLGYLFTADAGFSSESFYE